MSPVFADTSFYLALFNATDVGHAEALRWSNSYSRPVVLTEFILVELGGFLSRGNSRGFFVRLVEHLRSDPSNTIVPASKELFDAGLALFARRADKDWSLTDCISFVVMKQHNITQALTADRHFHQAGFTMLLKP